MIVEIQTWLMKNSTTLEVNESDTHLMDANEPIKHGKSTTKTWEVNHQNMGSQPPFWSKMVGWILWMMVKPSY